MPNRRRRRKGDATRFSCEVDLALGLAAAEAAKDGLHDVLGVHLAAERGLQPAACQRNQPAGELLEQVVGRLLVAGTEPGHAVGEGPVRAHAAVHLRYEAGYESGVIRRSPG